MTAKLGEILQSLGLVDEAGLQAALERKARLGKGRIGEHLVAVGAVDEEGLLRGLARQRRVPFADATVFARLDERLKKLVPRSKAFHYRVVPIRYLDGQLVLATCEAQNLERVRELIDALGHKVRLVLASRPPVEEAIARLYSFDQNAFSGRGEVPAPARLRARRPLRSRPLLPPPATRPDEATAPRSDADPAAVQARIAREIEPELAPNTGVFQLTREALAASPARSLPAGRSADDELDTLVRQQSQAQRQALAAPSDDDAQTVLDHDIGDRIRAELDSSPAEGDSDLWGPLNTGHLSLRLATPHEASAIEGRPLAVAPAPGNRGAAELEPRSGGEPFGNYRLLRKIKVGGMAEVFEAVTSGVEGVVRRVAIKRILPNLTDSDEFVAMFIDEAKITVQLNHAAIGQVFELGRVGDAYFISMEYICGRDLNSIFADAYEHGFKIPIPVATYIVQQVCEGLDYAHRKTDLSGNSLGIVHRDVSPANVLCSFDGMVKIIDFGIAKAVSKVSLTRPGLIKGKISYMSPEQMRGQPIDRRSDIFAVGIVLYELLAGRRLFAGDSDVETIRNVLKGEVPPIRQARPEIPEDLAAVVHRALERDPARRHAWASELSQDLQRVLLANQYSNVRGELIAYMQARFGGVPTGKERGA